MKNLISKIKLELNKEESYSDASSSGAILVIGGLAAVFCTICLIMSNI